MILCYNTKILMKDDDRLLKIIIMKVMKMLLIFFGFLYPSLKMYQKLIRGGDINRILMHYTVFSIFFLFINIIEFIFDESFVFANIIQFCMLIFFLFDDFRGSKIIFCNLRLFFRSNTYKPFFNLVFRIQEHGFF